MFERGTKKMEQIQEELNSAENKTENKIYWGTFSWQNKVACFTFMNEVELIENC